MKKKIFKIGLFADGVWSHSLIKLIKFNKDTELSFICRRFRTNDKIIEKLAKKFKIPLFKLKNVNSNYSFKKIKKFNCDMFLSMSYDQIFNNRIISHPSKKIINCHAGHLPKYRGRNVLNWAIINGEKNFYITVHYVNRDIDTGPILLRKKFKISKKDTYYSILKKAEKNCPILIFKVMKKVLEGKKIRKIYQSKSSMSAKYYFKRVAGDEIINFKTKSIKIFNFIRALSHPKLYATFLTRNKKYKIKSSQIITKRLDKTEIKSLPGTILKSNKSFFDVRSQDNKIRLFLNR